MQAVHVPLVIAADNLNEKIPGRDRAAIRNHHYRQMAGDSEIHSHHYSRDIDCSARIANKNTSRPPASMFILSHRSLVAAHPLPRPQSSPIKWLSKAQQFSSNNGCFSKVQRYLSKQNNCHLLPQPPEGNKIDDNHLPDYIKRINFPIWRAKCDAPRSASCRSLQSVCGSHYLPGSGHNQETRIESDLGCPAAAGHGSCQRQRTTFRLETVGPAGDKRRDATSSANET
ncbi:unnamed protein product [Chrysodeixis includens]|uniref:Uncharacterized protein n=1 Tax=Chrysodeixis includens TaxID=689277 RepID=A0A9N8KR17_CHRIL|nr:unnamed protein product [Chrysodeixis includens]